MYQSVLVCAHTKAIWTYQSSLHNFQTHFPTPYITTDNITRFTNFGFKLYRGIWRYFFSFLLNFFFFSFTDWCYENPSTCDTSQKVLSPPPLILRSRLRFLQCFPIYFVRHLRLISKLDQIYLCFIFMYYRKWYT